MKRHNDSFIRGVIVGHLLTSEVFRDYFEKRFAKALDSVNPPLAGVIQYKITEVLIGEDETKNRELYEWVDENYSRIFSHIEKSFLRDVIESVMNPRQNVHLN